MEIRKRVVEGKLRGVEEVRQETRVEEEAEGASIRMREK